jgi:hypothetical protein
MSQLQALARYVLLVVAIMSGSLSLIRESLQFVDPLKYPEKSLFFACLRGACIVAFALLWWQEARARKRAETELASSKPNLILSLGITIWNYNADIDQTIFFLSAGIVNRGEPSVTLNWRCIYHCGESAEIMRTYYITDTYTLTIKDKTIIFTNADLLNLKTIEHPIAKGQYVGGRLLFAVPGNRSDQIKALRHKLEVQCEDYLGTISKSEYVPSAEPVNELIYFHTERTENAKLSTQVETAGTIQSSPPITG